MVRVILKQVLVRVNLDLLVMVAKNVFNVQTIVHRLQMVCACLLVQPMSPLVNANVRNCFVATTVLPLSVRLLFHINLQTNKKNAEVTKEEIVTAKPENVNVIPRPSPP